MHVLMIHDLDRLADEGVMLTRLAVGLAGEGWRVTRVVPDDPMPEFVQRQEHRIELVPRIAVPMNVAPWRRKARLAAIREALNEHEPDVIWVSGRHAWGFANELSSAMRKPLVVDVWSRTVADRISASTGSMPMLVGLTAASEGLARYLRERVAADLVDATPIGVPSGPLDANGAARDRSGVPTLAIVGACSDGAAYSAVLSGLAVTFAKRPDLQAVMELTGPAAHEVWRTARRLNVLSQVTVVDRRSDLRPLLCGCRILLMPEALGEVRSLTLEAMAGGSATLCAGDAIQDYLVDGKTARFVRLPDTDAWARALAELLNTPALVEAIGAASREVIGTSHRCSRQVSTTAQAFERAVSGGTYRLQSA